MTKNLTELLIECTKKGYAIRIEKNLHGDSINLMVWIRRCNGPSGYLGSQVIGTSESTHNQIEEQLVYNLNTVLTRTPPWHRWPNVILP